MTVSDTLAPGSFDRVETLAYLGALIEDVRAPLSWRAFSDTVRGAKAYTWYGPFEKVVDELVAAQRKGYGVFVVVNATKPDGHDDASVTAPRAAFVDGDNIQLPESWPLPPTLIVCRDERHWHAYWMVEEGEDIARFRAVQKRLIAFYGSDEQVINESRVMRVAGFQHFKNPLHPQMYRVLKHAPAAVYTFDQILAAHPEGAGEAAKPKTAPEPKAEATSMSLLIPSGRRNNALASLGGHLRNLGLSNEAMEAALQRVNRERCSPPMDPAEVREVARSIARYDFDPVVAAVAAGAEPPKPAVVAPLVGRSHAERAASRTNPPQEVVEGLLPVGGIAAIIAMPGVGKTLLSLELARCVASGDPFASRATRRGRVVYLCPDAPASTERRMLAMPAEVADAIVSVVDIPKRLPADIEALRLLIEQENEKHPNNRVLLVLIDTWDASRTHSGGGYAEQDGGAEGVMSELRTLAERYRLAVGIVHHATRADGGRARGTVVFDARCDLIVTVDDAGGFGLVVEATKCRDGERGRVGAWSIEARMVGEKAVPVLVPQTSVAGKDLSSEARDLKVLRAIVSLVDAGETPSTRTIAEAVGVNRGGTMTRSIERLREAGKVDRKRLEPTAEGRRFANEEPGLMTCTADRAAPGGGAPLAPRCGAGGANDVTLDPASVHRGAHDSTDPTKCTATPFYTKGGAVQSDVSQRKHRIAAKPSEAEDLFALGDQEPLKPGRKKGSL